MITREELEASPRSRYIVDHLLLRFLTIPLEPLKDGAGRLTRSLIKDTLQEMLAFDIKANAHPQLNVLGCQDAVAVAEHVAGKWMALFYSIILPDGDIDRVFIRQLDEIDALQKLTKRLLTTRDYRWILTRSSDRDAQYIAPGGDVVVNIEPGGAATIFAIYDAPLVVEGKVVRSLEDAIASGQVESIQVQDIRKKALLFRGLLDQAKDDAPGLLKRNDDPSAATS